MQRYIILLNEVIASDDVNQARELQEEILAVIGDDLGGLKGGLSNYGFIMPFSTFSDLSDVNLIDDVDFIKDAKTLRSRLQVELEKIEAVQTESQPKLLSRTQEDVHMESKPHKLLISHSSKDKNQMVALVEMLEGIGMPEGTIVCSSVPGYGVPGGAKIYDWLRAQFITCDLRVLFALSQNYYSSAACLNEMGAAWITKVTDSLLLLPNFKFSDIRGCIDPTEVGIAFDSEDDELKHRHNELKDELITEHTLSPVNASKWERIRDSFISKVREISEEAETATEPDESDDTFFCHQAPTAEPTFHIPTEAAFLLVYAAKAQSQITRICMFGGAPMIATAGKQFMADRSPREGARWQEALDDLVNRGWVKAAGRKGEIFELTGTGYKNADWLKEEMQIDTKREPIEQLKEFE